MRDLIRRQLDKKLNPIRSIFPIERPNEGWLKAIRTSLGMTEQQLASKMGITRQAIKKIEKSEEYNTISLKTLIQAAQALNCKVQYVLVPEKPLEEVVDTQIKKKAKQIVENISHSMGLEEQATSKDELEMQIIKIVEDIKRRKNISMIWDENK
ncbi:mobile mystery protein A [Candidatus Nucleicultrix amoebiphila]|jgi:predicted DNA-binding mobile mystery protein A|uniref:HTH cro/C1-type domain-containing protein n=1 Tax=Candidatus Nucleicultrix amoebiphila FS5 TaxID=1414854 RepID=A0A1W6N313_9PROT|nr:mobile mystery protein A [Candidatus Nucleicultrix amoebiphila]ARN84287.1 hypothetical protein GQ61_01870 [Candidatus Nucleicultrix amoebiphila FS5]